MVITAAEGRNLGFNTPGGTNVPGSGTFDTVISLNTSITSPPNSLNGNYSLTSVTLHELDESLGIGGAGSNLGNGTAIGALDLYRYSAAGVRSFTTDPNATSYFSIDGGKTVLSTSIKKQAPTTQIGRAIPSLTVTGHRSRTRSARQARPHHCWG